VEVQEDQIRRFVANPLQGGRGTGEFLDRVAGRLEQAPQKRSNLIVIIHDQDSCGGGL
jgi:hypothetical protein